MARNDSLHIPVLLEQTLEVLAPRPGQTFVDCTLGLGGHAAAILERLKPDGRLIAFDLDAENIADARVQLQRVKGREGTVAFDLIHDNFANIEQGLDRLGIKPGTVDGVLADIGVASTQIDDPSRGFSYRRPGPLDMRMDPSRGTPAHELVNTLSEPELADVIWKYGDEESSRAIARLIVKHRKTTPIQTTQQLMAIVCEARNFTLERAAGAKLHPAARTFQALRILVNGELDNLTALLNALPRILKPGGMATIITFHSGEDRIVKHHFRDLQRKGIYSEDGRDPIIGTEEECRKNPRARSAKLRWAKRSAMPVPG